VSGAATRSARIRVAGGLLRDVAVELTSASARDPVAAIGSDNDDFATSRVASDDRYRRGE